MQLGLHLATYTWAAGASRLAPTLTEIARAAEAAGFALISTPDHVWQHRRMGGPAAEMLESYTTLGFLAACTKRVSLLTQVTAVSFRHPVMLAKSVTTLDVLSEGRAWLGLGAGNYEEEAGGSGLPFPPQKQRFELLEDTLQVCLRMWSGDESAFTGRQVSVPRPLNVPQSIARPHPPILVAGEGETKTLRLVARYADAAGLRDTPELPRKLDVLRRHCDEVGRDYDSILKTCAVSYDVSDGPRVRELVATLKRLRALGIDIAIGALRDVDRIEPLATVGREVIPALSDL